MAFAAMKNTIGTSHGLHLQLEQSLSTTPSLTLLGPRGNPYWHMVRVRVRVGVRLRVRVGVRGVNC